VRRGPMELLIGVLLLSLLVNLSLLTWVSRSDRFTLHWPRWLQSFLDAIRLDAIRLDATGPDAARRAGPADPLLASPRRPFFVATPGAPASGTAPAGAPTAAAAPLAAAPLAAAPLAAAPLAAAPAPLAAAPPAQSALSRSLPPDLTALLASPASLAPGAGGSGPLSGRDGSGRPDEPIAAGAGGEAAMLARLPGSRERSAGLGTDPLTGLEGPAGWSRLIEVENERLLRYRRPLTVVMVEVEGLRRLVERLGQEPLERLLPVIADAFRREARASDWVARIGESRFAALLPETDEIQAINYVERVRVVCEPWLASAAVPLRLAIGWSSPTASSDLEFALRRAEERMHTDRRMPGKSLQPPRVVPARVVAFPPAGPAAEAPGEKATEAAGEVAAEQVGVASADRQPVETRGRGRRKARPAAGAEAPPER
jgi:diguanylate cyclase (GGDEF)-like protein